MRRVLPVFSLALLLGAGVAHAQRLSAPPQTQSGLFQTGGNVAVRPGRLQAPERGDGPSARLRTPGKSHGSLMAAGPGDSLFSSTYDFQTNAAMPDRIINWPGATGVEGLMTTIATMAQLPGGGERGTVGAIRGDIGGGIGWASIDLAPPYEMIESQRSGFNEIDHLSDNRVVIASHNGASSGPTINFMVENSFGSGQFDIKTIPGSDAGLWPRVDVGGGDVIHVVWTEQSSTTNPTPPIWYARSTDMGTTFSEPVSLAGPGSATMPNRDGDAIDVPGSMSADAYVVSAAGEHVAIWYMTGGVDLVQLRSSDRGQTWLFSGYVARNEHVRVYRGDELCDSCMYDDPFTTSGDTIAFRSDTVASPGSNIDMLIDEDGTIYGVYPIVPSYLIRRHLPTGDSTTFIYQTLDSYTDAVGRSVWINIDDQFTSQGTIPVPEGADNSARFLDRREFGGGLASWFQLGMDAERNIYMVMASGQASDVVTATPEGEEEGNFMRSHIFATWTSDGQTWSDPTSLSPAGVDAQYPSLANLVDDEMQILYQADEYPGDFLTSSTSGSGLHPEVESTMMGYILPTNSIKEPGGVNDETGTSGAGRVLGAFPNPTVGRTEIIYDLGATSSVSLEIVDALGQRVMSIADGYTLAQGRHTVSFDASRLSGGAYFVVLTANGSVSTSRLNIAR